MGIWSFKTTKTAARRARFFQKINAGILGLFGQVLLEILGIIVAATGNAEHRHSFRFMLAVMDGQSEAPCAEEHSEGEDDMKHFAGQYNDLDKNKQR